MPCLILLQIFRRFEATKADVDKHIAEVRAGNFENMPDPGHLEHFRLVVIIYTAIY